MPKNNHIWIVSVVSLVIILVAWYMFGLQPATPTQKIQPQATQTGIPTIATNTGTTSSVDKEVVIEDPSSDIQQQDDKKDDDRVCTREFAPVCGTDNKTYSNACVAGNTPIAHHGPCEDAPVVSGEETIISSEDQPYKDTGSYIVYDNTSVGYGFSLPRYAYYQGGGRQDGAVHTMGVGLTGSGVEDFSQAPVQIFFYKKAITNPPIKSQSVVTPKGILYVINNDSTGDVRLAKIAETILASAR